MPGLSPSLTGLRLGTGLQVSPAIGGGSLLVNTSFPIPGAIIDFDPYNGRYFGAGPQNLVVDRASPAWGQGANGDFVQSQNNQAVILPLRGILPQEARTNSIRNPRGSGGAPGTTSLPTNFAVFAANGLTTTFVDRVTVQGLPGFRIRISGTSTGAFYVLGFDFGIAATNGLSYTQSLIAYRTGGSWTNITTFRSELRFETVSAFTVNSASVLSDTPTVYTSTGTASAVGQTLAQSIALFFPSGVGIDITLDIAAPLLRQGTFAGNPILNPVGVTNSATTQQADNEYVPVSLPSSYLSDGFTLYGETPALAAHVSNGTVIEAWASANDRSSFNVSQTTNGGQVVSGGVSRSIPSVAAGGGSRRKVAIRIKPNDIRMAVNGTLNVLDTGVAPAALPTRVYIGSANGGTANFLNDWEWRWAFLPALNDTQLTLLSTL